MSSRETLWQRIQTGQLNPGQTVFLAALGFIVGACAAAVVSAFRITAGSAYEFVVGWCLGHDSWWAFILCLALAFFAALFTGFLIRDPAIRSGGAQWIREALENGQPHVFRLILLPKFIGSWIVKACGVSVGMEGPSIQMGCATALGIANLNGKRIERRFFMLGGCAAGLATAFSAPFSGICYVYEIMRERMSGNLFIFLLSGSFGVYFTCIGLFGLDPLLPFTGAPMPGVGRYWLIALLALFSGALGVAYNYLLRGSLKIFDGQKLIPVRYRPLCAFAATCAMLFLYPAATGEGMDVFPPLDAGVYSLLFLWGLLAVKLIFTAFCYGTGIPAGQMVPILCIGGIAGAIFSLYCQSLGLLGPDFHLSCITIGMAGAFSASERAPVTGLVLVAQMTGAWSTGAGILLAVAISTFLARIARVRPL